jgi:hypothetical protein
MTNRSVVIIGLPESGKTTFLAALWHLITERDINTALRFDKLGIGDAAHLNAIAAQWRNAKVQERTSVGGNKMVSMNFLDAADAPSTVTFPDIAGEAYRRMWEERTCEPEVEEILKAGGVLLFVHTNTIQRPQWVIDEIALSKKLGLPVQEGQEVPWHPRLSPTQVQLVGLLQLLREPPLDTGPRRLAVMLSAWDKVNNEEALQPEDFLKTNLPLLHQYLHQAADKWTWRAYGLSAQGGEYDDETKKNIPPSAEAEALRQLDQPSMRIRLLQSSSETHDLTEPLSWLMA